MTDPQRVPFRTFPELSGAMPTLSPEQIERLGSFGTALDVETGDTLFRAGEPTVALFLLDTASGAVVRPATLTRPEEPIIEFGPGHFVGEFTLLTGQNQYLTATVTAPAGCTGSTWPGSGRRWGRTRRCRTCCCGRC